MRTRNICRHSSVHPKKEDKLLESLSETKPLVEFRILDNKACENKYLEVSYARNTYPFSKALAKSAMSESGCMPTDKSFPAKWAQEQIVCPRNRRGRWEQG